jgi:hypothetical protein
MYVKELGYERVHWSCMIQDRDQWWAFVNMVKSLGFDIRWGIS